jgi:hypothetical protein
LSYFNKQNNRNYNAMPTVFIDNIAVLLPSRFALGDIINEAAAYTLNDIQQRRIKAKLRYLLARGDILQWDLQTKADELASQDLVPYMTLDDDEPNTDPILMEALAMARELIVGRMAQEGLPPPKGLDIHAKALVDAMPDLQEKARLRIEARYRAAQQAIQENPVT